MRNIQCLICGSNDLELNENYYKCKNCGSMFENVDIEKSLNEVRQELNKTITNKINEAMEELQNEKIANARMNLYEEINQEFLSTEKIKNRASNLKDLLSNDILANFFYNIDNITSLEKYIKKINFTKINISYTDIMVEFLLKSPNLLEKNIPSLLNKIINTCYQRTDEKWQKYYNEFVAVIKKVDAGFFDVNLPRDVFVAYSSKDRDFVLDLVEFLENNKFNCFVSFRNLQHGNGSIENYERELKMAIDNCKVFLFISSINSRSRDCDALKVEMRYIKDRDTKNFPLMFNNTPYEDVDYKYKKPRIEYVIEDYNNKNSLGETLTNEFFSSLERVYERKNLLTRINNLINNENININQNETKFCVNCMTENNIYAKFCMNCGKNLFAKTSKEAFEKSKLLNQDNKIEENKNGINNNSNNNIFSSKIKSIVDTIKNLPFVKWAESESCFSDNVSFGKRNFASKLDLKIGHTVNLGIYSGNQIEWEVIRIIKGKALLVSKYILENKCFDKCTNKWEYSEIRRWLNNDFYNNVFTENEKERIVIYNTQDKVFLLSKEEVEMNLKKEKDRLKTGTQHAKRMGLKLLTNNTYLRQQDKKYIGYSLWYLRSNTKNYIDSITPYGKFGYTNEINDCGIVPAIVVKIK